MRKAWAKEVMIETKCALSDLAPVKAAKMVRRTFLQKLGEGLSFHLIRCAMTCGNDPARMEELWLSYIDHKKGIHTGCVDEERGYASKGDACCKDYPSTFDESSPSLSYSDYRGRSSPIILT
eukprot:TRINITY_DN16207_c0_g1_i1.p3 TRINITY_DN16207_c0_g1~~TRINITY_DN16207_c0_g1_i1.p3  ORF type:complete len:122 (-),score=20.88 TRINITY_DN16207_c0_g1_i1:366-731(-)